MKSDVIMYEKVYQILKNKIECGLLAGGAKLPSRAKLCREFGTSEKTVRRAVEMLAREGFVETRQRMRPMVVSHRPTGYCDAARTLKKAGAVASGDLLKTGVLLCYPLNARGLALCTGEEFQIPEAILRKMDPAAPAEFWRLSNRFWRFFLARNENDLALRAVDILGFAQIEPLHGTFEIRLEYRQSLEKLLETVKRGRDPESVPFRDLSSLYEEEGAPACRWAPDAALPVGTNELGRHISKAEERYSGVYLDLLGLIAVGRYRPGECLPSHEELREIYGVSSDTTVKAVKMLQEWGAVKVTRGKGIFVAMDLEGLKEIEIDPALIACHVRRFLDCLELLSLTAEGVAAHAAAHITAVDAKRHYDDLDALWNGLYLYQLSPRALLDFLTQHIRYDPLRTVYDVVRKNYRIGRCIPKLVNRVKTPGNREIHRRCMEAVGFLVEGNHSRFAERAADMFRFTHQLVVSECKRLGYWEAAMAVYDGSALWK